MDRDAIRTKIRDLLRDIVEEDSLELTDATKATDVEWWDSLTHLKLLVAIEEEWGLTFELVELSSPENVGELVDLIGGKMAG